MELNEQQKKAVNHDTGPLLIIAGAGTGKTRAITSRIVELIKSGKAKPEEVLALTFTEKAASEMVERVDMDMPLGYEELLIKTFHSFCERILRESGLEIGIDPGFKILSQLDQWFLFKKNLFEFDLDYYRPLGNPNKFIYDLLNHVGKLKDELITPEAYQKYAEGFEGEEGEKLQEIAKLYADYKAMLIKNNALDFGDLIYYTIQLLEKRESVLKEYQERFKYIMVDEFQDTNYAQFKLVNLLAARHENVVVVGDDDQSIYKWRGASLSNILQFEDQFPEHEKVVLTDNYRSTSSILNGSYELIKNNNPDRLEERAGINKNLVPHCEYDSPIEAHHFANYAQETEFVAKKIAELKESEGINYSDFAILVRSNMLAHPFIDEFKLHNIPFQVRSPKGLMSLEEIKDLISVVRFLANPYDDIAFTRILKMDVYGIQMAEILKLLKDAGNEHMYDHLNTPGDNDNLTIPGTESGVEMVISLVNELIEFSKNNSVGLVLNEFLTKSGYLQNLAEKEMFEEMSNINEFAKQIGRFEKENDHRTVRDFSGYIDLLEESNSVMPYEGDTDKDAVQILTAHGSKGLEFENVFVVSCVKQRFPVSKRRDVFDIPEELTKEIFPDGDYHIQEERRLFYVAMTRARRNLFLTYSDQYEGNKTWKASPFISEVLKAKAYAKLIEHEETEDALNKLKSLKAPIKAKYELPPFTRKRLSYSQLDTFKTCPLKYAYRYMMKLPTPMSHAGNYGTSVHEALNEFYRALKRGVEPTFELMEKLYEENWIPHGYDSKEHEVERKRKGLEVLKTFYETNGNPWVMPAFLERNFNLRIGEYLISGRIDRIDKLDDGTFEVIDYKTGKLKKGQNLDTDLQLTVYALACKEVLGLEVSKLSLYFLEDNQKVSTTRGKEQLEVLRFDIESLVGQMKQSDFDPTPGFLCRFCDFKLICPAV